MGYLWQPFQFWILWRLIKLIEFSESHQEKLHSYPFFRSKKEDSVKDERQKKEKQIKEAETKQRAEVSTVLNFFQPANANLMNLHGVPIRLVNKYFVCINSCNLWIPMCKFWLI